MEFEHTIRRCKIEETEEWQKWTKEIPVLDFPVDWQVKIIPPYGGAIVRFLVLDNSGEQKVSVYLDCYDRLGFFGSPYWEIYPYNEDVYRISMNNTEELIYKIQEVIDGKDND